MIRLESVVVGVVLGVLITLPAAPAFAQQPGAPPPASASATSPPAGESSPSPAMVEAKERFTRGLKLYEDRNYEAARVEFERAYALAPSWKLLYNIGYCYRQLNDYVAAIKALERFLSEGGSEIATERRDEVSTSLVDLRTRIASIEISVFGGEGGSKTTPAVGATILIDDVPVGTSPLKEAIVVNPGRRKVSAAEQGGTPVTQIVTVAGRETAHVNLELTGPRTIVVEKKSASIAPYVAWGVTGAFVAGTVVTGILALDAKADQQQLLGTLGTSPQVQQKDLDDARDKTRTLGTVSDALLAGSILAGGVATYLTVKALTKREPSSPEKAGSDKRGTQASFTGTGLVLSGRF